jgi:hypothetical protein
MVAPLVLMNDAAVLPGALFCALIGPAKNTLRSVSFIMAAPFLDGQFRGLAGGRYASLLIRRELRSVWPKSFNETHGGITGNPEAVHFPAWLRMSGYMFCQGRTI